MLDRLTGTVDFHGKALVLRSERQRTIASNIANADTPGYQARDFDFKSAMQEAVGSQDARGLEQPRPGLTGSGLSPQAAAVPGATHPMHLRIPQSLDETRGMGYRAQTQPAMDNNSVDMDRERGAFVDNAVRYESTLRFINGYSKTILGAITGQ